MGKLLGIKSRDKLLGIRVGKNYLEVELISCPQNGTAVPERVNITLSQNIMNFIFNINEQTVLTCGVRVVRRDTSVVNRVSRSRCNRD